MLYYYFRVVSASVVRGSLGVSVSCGRLSSWNYCFLQLQYWSYINFKIFLTKKNSECLLYQCFTDFLGSYYEKQCFTAQILCVCHFCQVEGRFSLCLHLFCIFVALNPNVSWWLEWHTWFCIYTDREDQCNFGIRFCMKLCLRFHLRRPPLITNASTKINFCGFGWQKLLQHHWNPFMYVEFCLFDFHFLPSSPD